MKNAKCGQKEEEEVVEEEGQPRITSRKSFKIRRGFFIYFASQEIVGRYIRGMKNRTVPFGYIGWFSSRFYIFGGGGGSRSTQQWAPKKKKKRTEIRRAEKRTNEKKKKKKKKPGSFLNYKINAKLNNKCNLNFALG